MKTHQLYLHENAVMHPASAEIPEWFEAACVREVTETNHVSRPMQSSMVRPMRLVAVLAFIQSLLFLALWLFVCAFAGASEPAADKALTLRVSSYEPVKTRDPLLRTEVKSVVGQPSLSIRANDFQLQGILYHPTRASAMVNDHLVMVRRPTTIVTAAGPVEVTAVEITRDFVRMKVGGEIFELRMEPYTADENASATQSESPTPAKPSPRAK